MSLILSVFIIVLPSITNAALIDNVYQNPPLINNLDKVISISNHQQVNETLGSETLEYIQDLGIPYIKDELLFKANEDISQNEVEKLISSFNGSITEYIEPLKQYVAKFQTTNPNELENIINLLKQSPILNPNTINLNLVICENANITPNDPWDGTISWNLENPSGSNWGIEAIKAPSAWQYTNKMESVNVGLLEFGNFYTNKDLNFVKETYIDSKSKSSIFHGNHVAGIIGAIPNNNIGITGVAPNSKLYGYGNVKTVSSLLKSMTQALKDDNVKVLNYSSGFSNTYINKNTLEYLKKYANEQIGSALKDLLYKDGKIINNDFVIVTAAGNYRNNTNPVSSAEIESYFNLIGGDGYEELNCIKNRIIVVGAISNDGNNQYSIAPFTQLGKRVDIMAPGVDIYSTLGNNLYGTLSGTSSAAPHVSGVATILWGLCPTLNGEDIKKYIVDTADRNVFYYGDELTETDFKSSYPILNTDNLIKKLIQDGKI